MYYNETNRSGIEKMLKQIKYSIRHIQGMYLFVSNDDPEKNEFLI